MKNHNGNDNSVCFQYWYCGRTFQFSTKLTTMGSNQSPKSIYIFNSKARNTKMQAFKNILALSENSEIWRTCHPGFKSVLTSFNRFNHIGLSSAFNQLDTKIRNTTCCPQLLHSFFCSHLTPVSLCSHAKFEDLCLVFQ